MTLLNSFALVASSALIVPIFIHLRRHRKVRSVDWPAMQFLSQSILIRRRGLRLEEFLLFFLRCLIILLFALAMARPVIPPGQTLRWISVTGLAAGGLVLLVFSLVGQMTAFRRTAGVSLAVVLLATHSMTGVMRSISSCSEISGTPVIADCPPISRMSAPCSMTSCVRSIRASTVAYLPASLKESGVALMTAIIKGRSISSESARATS